MEWISALMSESPFAPTPPPSPTPTPGPGPGVLGGGYGGWSAAAAAPWLQQQTPLMAGQWNFSPVSYLAPNMVPNLRPAGTLNGEPVYLLNPVVQCLTVSRPKRKRRQKKDDGQPRAKKPLNAFMLYLREQRKNITGMDSAAVNKILGERWNQLTKDQKARYYEQVGREAELQESSQPPSFKGPGQANIYSDAPSPLDIYSDDPSPTDIHSDAPSPTDIYSDDPSPTDIYSDVPSPTDIYSDDPSPTDIYSDDPSPTDIYSDVPSPTDIHSDAPSPPDTFYDPPSPPGTSCDVHSTPDTSSGTSSLSSRSKSAHFDGESFTFDDIDQLVSVFDELPVEEPGVTDSVPEALQTPSPPDTSSGTPSLPPSSQSTHFDGESFTFDDIDQLVSVFDGELQVEEPGVTDSVPEALQTPSSPDTSSGTPSLPPCSQSTHLESFSFYDIDQMVSVFDGGNLL